MNFVFKMQGDQGRLLAALDEIRKKVGRQQVNVGFLEGSTYPDGTSTPMVAAVQEFGATISHSDGHTTVIPPRPFMRNTVAKNSSRWGDLLGAALKASDLNAKQALALTGLKVVSQMQDEVKALTEPPLAPSTVKAKGFDTPLIDTGHLLNSIASEVVGS